MSLNMGKVIMGVTTEELDRDPERDANPVTWNSYIDPLRLQLDHDRLHYYNSPPPHHPRIYVFLAG